MILAVSFASEGALPTGAITKRARLWVPAGAATTRSDARVLIACDSRATWHVVPRSYDGPCTEVLFEGALDNMSDMRRMWRDIPLTARAPEAVAVAFRADGVEAVKKMHGDFRCIVYQPESDLLVGFVDFVRTRPMWWRQCPEKMVLGSDCGFLFSQEERIEVDREYLSVLLRSAWCGGRAGALRGSLRLSGGEFISCRAGTGTVDSYWTPQQWFGRKAGISETDAVESFGLLFREGVTARISQRNPIMCDLSGGLDSSAVTAVVSDVVKPDPRISVHGVTVGYPGAGDSDETAWASQVAIRAGAHHHLIRWDEREPLFRGFPNHASYWDEPTFGVHSYATARIKSLLLRLTGGDSYLSGSGAEALMCHGLYWPIHLADDLLRFQWLRLHSQLRRWHHASSIGLPVLWFRACVAPLFGAVRPEPLEPRANPTWLTTAALRGPDTRDQPVGRLAKLREGVACSWMVEHWRGADYIADRGIGASLFDTRYPFLHRPLVEAVLALPWSVRIQPRDEKHLLKRSIGHLLPPAFASKQSLAADHAVCRAFAVQGSRLLSLADTSALADLGMIEPKRLRLAIQSAQQGLLTLPFLLTTLAAELWARSVLTGTWRSHLPGRLKCTP